MPKVVYFGPAPAHVGSLPSFAPGEAREVNEATADLLLKNVHFGLVAEPEPESVKEAASEKPAKKAPSAPEGV